MKRNVVQEKTYSFALEIISVCRILQDQKDFIISNQLLKSGTSVGANVRESQSAESSKDFIHKLSVALKESKETDYWLHLLRDSELISPHVAEELISQNEEIGKILAKIIITSKRNNNIQSRPQF